MKLSITSSISHVTHTVRLESIAGVCVENCECKSVPKKCVSHRYKWVICVDESCPVYVSHVFTWLDRSLLRGVLWVEVGTLVKILKHQLSITEILYQILKSQLPVEFTVWIRDSSEFWEFHIAYYICISYYICTLYCMYSFTSPSSIEGSSCLVPNTWVMSLAYEVYESCLVCMSSYHMYSFTSPSWHEGS